MIAAAVRDEIAEAYAAALERREARRNHYTTYDEAEVMRAKLDGRVLDKVSIYAPELRGPLVLAEWWDDRLLACGSRQYRGCPDVAFLAMLAAAAAEGGAGAAVKAVKQARQLERRAQVTVYANLAHWRSDRDAVRFGADRVIGQALGEWVRLGLAESEDDDE